MKTYNIPAAYPSFYGLNNKQKAEKDQKFFLLEFYDLVDFVSNDSWQRIGISVGNRFFFYDLTPELEFDAEAYNIDPVSELLSSVRFDLKQYLPYT